MAARIGRPVAPDEHTRISAFLADVTGLIEDYCGRDMVRRQSEAFTLFPEGACRLAVPGRFSTFLTVDAVHQDGQAVSDWTWTGRQLVRGAGWGQALITVTGSWGYQTPPASLKAITCSEVIRWLALSPGVESERVGEVEVSFSGASAAQALSAISKASLKPYRRRGAGSITLLKEGPRLDARGPHAFYD
ncbi:phage gp6-like head-tail connector protein [Streptomyces sp. H27-H5]|uniref:phage gp6-like head-tail connector protein n=1 Tax=Streptomyces sp. H27-H5 TaxID=2996460 RepID=UPI00226E40F8|nr:phage gp6-like head-tail connector protein [Streptomyces sp. H27-H5]MCY0962739.1 phage gp6-like head-tail connector protein [Streptomyces sp. H27-H5]